MIFEWKLFTKISATQNAIDLQMKKYIAESHHYNFKDAISKNKNGKHMLRSGFVNLQSTLLKHFEF